LHLLRKVAATSAHAGQVSRQRRLTGADAGPSKRGPHGGHLCRWCKAEVFPPRKTFCCDECVNEWRLRSDVAYLRSQLFLRDRGVCRACAIDTLQLRRRLYDLTEQEREIVGAEHGIPAYHARNLMLWEADHVVPVSHGGGLTGLENFQTLCVRCHQRKTLVDRVTSPSSTEG